MGAVEAAFFSLFRLESVANVVAGAEYFVQTANSEHPLIWVRVL